MSLARFRGCSITAVHPRGRGQGRRAALGPASCGNDRQQVPGPLAKISGKRWKCVTRKWHNRPALPGTARPNAARRPQPVPCGVAGVVGKTRQRKQTCFRARTLSSLP